MTGQLERWQIVDQNFIRILQSNTEIQTPNYLVECNTNFHNFSTDITRAIKSHDFYDLMYIQFLTRHIDLQARALKQKNLSYYTIASAGHENNAVFGHITELSDIGILHYRSAAFMLARANKISDEMLKKQVKDQLRSIIASKYDGISQGRHKVLGSVELNVPPQTSTIASHLPKALGLALSINQNRVLNGQSKKTTSNTNINFSNHLNANSIVLCSFGDASFNHSTAQGALNATRFLCYENIPLPLIYICEDNNIGISVKTPHNWIESNFNDNNGLVYIRANGLDIIDTYIKAKQAVHIARVNKKPVFFHLKTSRLMGHAGSDIEQTYLSLNEIASNEAKDPLLFTAMHAIEDYKLSHHKILKIYEECRCLIENITKEIINEPKLSTCKEVVNSIIPQPKKIKAPRVISDKLKINIFNKLMSTWQHPRNMAQAINLVLAETLAQYKDTIIFGEDVGKKGGVYSVTTNLQKIFGRKRVFDTILDEQTIIGTAIGYAQNNILPIIEIQFLAYIHNAIDQLRGEAATLPYFSGGKFSNPMLIRIPGLAYQKGFGGHFHNDNSLAALREIPGIIIACPSNAYDAVKMWRTLVREAYLNNRVCVFIEPIALYFTKNLYVESDNLMLANYPEARDKLEFGCISIYEYPNEQVSINGSNNFSKDNNDIRVKNKLVIISFANGFYLSQIAVNKFIESNPGLVNEIGLDISIIDLHWLHPLPMDKLYDYLNNLYIINNSSSHGSLTDTDKSINLIPESVTNILIVDETRKTGSISEELYAELYEYILNTKNLNKIKLNRLTAVDSFIPLGPAAELVLPSIASITGKIKAIYNI